MSDQTETAAAPETTIPTADPFAAEWEAQGLSPAPAAEPAKSVVKSDSLPVDAPAKVVQGGSEEPRATFDPGKLADAMDEISRARLEPDAFKGKSESELIALGVELNTRRRQRDREWQEAQGHSKDDGAKGQTPGDTAQAPDSSAKETPSLDPAKLDEILNPFVEEFGEEAAPVVTLLKSLAQQNAALEARLNADVQARQLAPLEQAIKEETAGNEALSNPEKLDKFLVMARAKAEFDGIDLGTDQIEAARRVIRNALPASQGAPAPLQRVNTVAPAGTRSAPTSKKEADPFAETWKELGLPT